MDCVISAMYEVDPYVREDQGLEPSLTRGMTCDHYVGGIYSLAAFNKPIILFCNDRPIRFKGREMTAMELLDDIIPDKEFLKRITPVPIKLQNFYTKYDKHWTQSKRIVDENPKQLYCWNPPMACVRPEFFNYVFKNFDYKNAIWFDAALSNESYVNEQFGGTWHDWELIKWDNYYPKNENAIFCPKFYNNILKIVEEYGNVVCGNSFLNLEPRKFIRERLHNRKKADGCFTYFSSTGAFMGFNKDYFYDKFIEEYNIALDDFIDNYNNIFTEIEVLSYINMFLDFAKVNWGTFSSNMEIFEGSMQEAFKKILDGNIDIRFNNYFGQEEKINPPGDDE